MPVTLSQIIEDSEQADGRRWITEEHTASTGQKHRVTYLCPAGVNAETIMNNRVDNIDQQLIETEIAIYLDRIEEGKNVIGLNYVETTQKYRALQFLLWGKEMIQDENFQALRWAYLVIDPYTETQINTLMAGTAFANKADKIKAWVLKIKDMKLAMNDTETAAGEV